MSLIAAAGRLAERFRSQRVFFWLVAWRVWSFAAAPITLLLLAREVSAAGQGAYYGFLSLGAVITWFELGIGGLMVQGIAFERARSGGPVAGAENLSVRVYQRWYSCAAAAYGALAALAGLLVLRGTGLPSDWLPCWLLYVAANAVGFRQTFRIQYLEAVGEVARSYMVRLSGAAGLSVVLWLGIFAGQVLWGLGVAGFVQVGIRAWLLAADSRRYPLPPERPDWQESYRIWKSRILPLQWRTAVAVVCGYVVYQSGVLMALRMVGPEASGALGFALQVAAVVSAAGMIPLSAVAVELSRLGGAGDYVRFWRKVVVCAWQCMGFAFIGLAVVISAILVARYLDWIPSSQIPSTAVLCVAVICAVAGVCSNICVIACRALRQDPFVPVYVGAALLWLVVVPYIVRDYGVSGLLMGMIAVQGIGMVLGHVWLLNRVRCSSVQ